MPGSTITSGITGTREIVLNGEKKTVFNYKVKGSIDPALIAEGTDKIIEAVTQKHQTKIDEKTNRIKALKEVESALQLIGKKLLALRGEPHLKGFENKNVFLERHLGIQNKDITDQKPYMECICDPGSPLRQFTMAVKQLAAYDQTISPGAYYPQTLKDPLELQGKITVNGIDVEITQDMSLENVKAAFASASKRGKFNVFIDALTAETSRTPGAYRLYLQSTEEGDPLVLSETSGSGVLAALNIQESRKTKDELSAKLFLNGIEITRSSNKISDLIEGCTFNVMGITPGTDHDYLTLKTEKNLVKIRDVVSELAAALKEFYALENKYCARDTQGNALEEAFLVRSPVMEKIIKDLDGFLRQALPGGPKGNIKIGAEIGFSLDREADGTHKFSFDEAKFIKALMEKPDKIEDFFSWKVQWEKPYFYSGSSGRPLQGALRGQPIRLKVWRESEGPEGVRAALKTPSSNWTEATFSNGFIKGKQGTMYEPLHIAVLAEGLRQVNHPGETLETTLTIAQGKADELMGQLFPGIVGVLGRIQREPRIEKEITALEQDTKNLTDKMNRDIQRLQEKKESMMARLQKLNEAAEKFERAKQLQKANQDFFESGK